MPHSIYIARIVRPLMLLIAAWGCAAGANDASQRPAPATPSGWQIGLGLAPVVSPVFEGADNYGFSVFPDLRVMYGDRFLASVPDGISYRAINGAQLQAGPIARIRFGREEDNGGSPFLLAGSADDLEGLGDIDAAAELGGFVSLRHASWHARAELRRGFGGHEGIVGDVSLDYTGGNRHLRYAVGPRLRLGSDDFVSPYFGIDQTQAARSGLPVFDADGGLNSAGIGFSVVVPRGERLTVLLFGGYDRLLGDVADSPLVDQRGSADQLSLGAALSWRFDLGGVLARH